MLSADGRYAPRALAGNEVEVWCRSANYSAQYNDTVRSRAAATFATASGIS